MTWADRGCRDPFAGRREAFCDVCLDDIIDGALPHRAFDVVLLSSEYKYGSARVDVEEANWCETMP